MHMANREVEYHFSVYVTVRVDDPKRPTIEQLENRIADGPQWMDGVSKVQIDFERQEPSDQQLQAQALGDGALNVSQES